MKPDDLTNDWLCQRNVENMRDLIVNSHAACRRRHQAYLLSLSDQQGAKRANRYNDLWRGR